MDSRKFKKLFAVLLSDSIAINKMELWCQDEYVLHF